MARENKAKWAVLGLLSLRPQSGYDVKQTCDRALKHFWSEGYGSIYPILKRLEAAGLATSTVERQEGRPDRNVYAITAAGEAALRDWLAEPVAPPAVRNEMLLKLFLGPRGDGDRLLANVRRYREQHEDKLAAYEALAAEVASEYADSEFRPYWEMSLDYGRRICRAYVEWCLETERKLEKRNEESR